MREDCGAKVPAIIKPEEPEECDPCELLAQMLVELKSINTNLEKVNAN